MRGLILAFFLVAIVAASSATVSDSQAGDRPILTGSWKRDCGDGFGLRIAQVGPALYSISFCGPGGCSEPGSYRRDSAIYGDERYRVIDARTIETFGRDGWSRYQRCAAEGVPEAVGPTASKVEDSLARVVLGSNVAQLFDAYRGLYAHGLVLGEVLYEACNQETLTVFSFVEESWSRGRVTRIWVRKAEDPSICRDEEGSLPDTSVPPSTSRGLKIGDPARRARELYGPPSELKERDHKNILLYRFEVPKDARIKNPALSVILQDDVVTGMILSGDIPGARKPPELAR